ncbi:MAG: hypothetical protein ACLQEQ_09930 [Nitrososphaerales archaeon]
MAEQEKAGEAVARRWATLVGSILEFLLTVQTTVVVAYYVRHGSIYASFVYPKPNYPALAIAVFFPFAYSLAHKYFAKPKGRTISPAVMFLLAFVFNTIFLADYVIRAPADYYQGILIQTLPLTEVWGNFATFTFVFLVMIVFLASFSVAGVRLALGLSVEGIDRKTYHTTLSHDAVFNAFKKGSLTSGYLSRFREQEQDEKAIFLKRKYPNGDEIILAFGYDPSRPDQGTTIATAAYGKNAYGLLPSASASGLRDSIVYDIMGRCPEAERPTEKTKPEDLNDFLSERVYQIAVKPAKAWLAVVKDSFLELERYFQFAIISTVAATVAATIASAEGWGNLNYGDALIVLYALLVGEIGLAIREERARGKKSPSWEFKTK